MKQEIKQWLRRTNKDRKWLANAVGVHKRTVDNWLSSPKEIPTSTQILIQSLMDADAKAEAEAAKAPAIPDNLLVLEVDGTRFDAYSEAARYRGETLKGWAMSELDRAALYARNQQNMEDASIVDPALVAEKDKAVATIGGGVSYSSEPKLPAASIVPNASQDAAGTDAQG